MGVRTCTYVMMGADLPDLGRQLAARHPGDEDWLSRNYGNLAERRRHKAGSVALVYDGMCGRYMRVGLLLADVVRDDEPGRIDVSLGAEDLARLAALARSAVAAELELDIEPRLLAFTHSS